MPAPIALDRRLTSASSQVTTVFDGTNTTWTLPYETPLDGSEGVLRAIQDDSRELLDTTQVSATAIRAEGNYLGILVHLGVAFQFFAQFSVIFARDRESGLPDLRGRTNVRYLKLFYEEATSFTVVVASEGRDPREYVFAAEDLSTPESGVFTVPIQSQNTKTTITVVAEDAGAAGFSGYEWEGVQYTRVRRA